MRIPRWLAWLVLGLTLFTCGLLRHFHEVTPRSPYVHPALGSLLFAAVVLVFLVSIREKTLGAVPGKGVRFGSVTPILLMLLVEKWISIGFYGPAFRVLSPAGASEGISDARFRALAGLGLLLTCVVLALFSRPTRRQVAEQLRPRAWLVGTLTAFLAIAGTYGLLFALSAALRADFHLVWPSADRVLVWVLFGQALRALAEEVYYRGFLQSEMARVAPRLGASKAAARRWIALVLPSVLFAMEHVPLGLSGGDLFRQVAFTLSLGLLLGILVMLTRNLIFAAGMHAWINWLLLAAAPRFVEPGQQASSLPSGTYIGLALALAFLAAFYLQPRKDPSAASHPGGSLP